MLILRRSYVVLFCFFATLLWQAVSSAQDAEDIERHVKSAYIYQFTKLIKWPPKNGDFVIYVIEDDPLIKILETVVADRSVETRKIKVQAAKWSDVVLKPGDIVVFPKKESSFHKAVIEKLKDKPCLVVSFSEGLAAAGSSINFFMSEDKIKFELNTTSIKTKALTTEPILVKLAKLVE